MRDLVLGIGLAAMAVVQAMVPTQVEALLRALPPLTALLRTSR